MKQGEGKSSGIPRHDVSGAAKSVVSRAAQTLSGLGRIALSGISGLKSGLIASVFNLTAGFMVVSGHVGSALGVSAVTAALFMGAAGVSTAGAVGFVAYDMLLVSSIERFGAYIDDCISGVDALRSMIGPGERQIPEKVGDYTVGVLPGTYEAPMWWMLSGNSGTEDRVVAMHVANKSGTTDSNGFFRFGKYYLGAIASAGFGMTEDTDAYVGDWITIYFDDGDAIEYLVVDTKGDSSGTDINGNHFDYHNGTPMDKPVSLADPQGGGRDNVICAWGHVDTASKQVNCLEFVVGVSNTSQMKGSPYALLGHSGGRIVSFTNHGTAPEVASANGWDASVMGGSRDAQSSGKSSAIRNAVSNCLSSSVSHSNNSSIADAAVSYAYSKQVKLGDGYKGTKLWLKVFHAVYPGDVWERSCDRATATAVRWSGSDDEFPAGDCAEQHRYCSASDKWKTVGTFSGDTSVLEPGDVLIMSGQHTCCYVGSDAIANHVFTGDADVGEP